MNKAETIIIVDRVRANWNWLNLSKDKEIALYETWHRYLEDQPFPTVESVVDSLITSNGPFPRVGEVRKRAVDTGRDAPPSIGEAIAQAGAATEAVNWGTDVPDMHPDVNEALRAYRNSGGSGVGGYWSEKAFVVAYEKVLAKRYAL